MRSSKLSRSKHHTLAEAAEAAGNVGITEDEGIGIVGEEDPEENLEEDPGEDGVGVEVEVVAERDTLLIFQVQYCCKLL